MQLLRLRLVNFRQHELTDLTFGTGMIGIVGPNGAGKTTLLEAIAYALYGVPGTRGTRETLRRRNALPRSRFEVLLEFSLGPHTYSVLRTLTAAELKEDGNVIANSTGAVTERVTALLGMTRDAFFNTYFTGQKELAVMASMGTVERGKFLSRVLGYERLREAQDRLREERSAMRSELTGIEQGLADPDLLQAELTTAAATLDHARVEREAALAAERASAERVATLSPEWDAARTRRTAWQALDGERRVAEAKVSGARAGFQALDKQLATAMRARDRLVELAPVLVEWNALIAQRDAMDQAAVAYTARSNTVAARDQGKRRLAELEPQLATLPDRATAERLSIARAEALATREQAELVVAERHRHWTQDAQEVRTKLEQFRDAYRELKDQRAKIEAQGPEGTCPTCGRPLGTHFTETVELMGRQLADLEVSGTYLRQRHEQLVDAPADIKELEAERQRVDMELRRATEALGQLQAQLREREKLEADRVRITAEVSRLEAELTGPAADYDGVRHGQVRARLAELEPLRREHDQLSGLAQRAEALVTEASRAEQAASTAETELAALDERIALLGWNPDAFTAIEMHMRDADAALQAALVSVARAGAALEGAERLRNAALLRQQDRTEKADIAKRLGGQIALLEELDRAYSDLRTELNLQLRPDLAESASTFLRDLTAGRYTDLELDEGYVATIVEDGEAKPVISGGEEDVVNLALRLAISQMIAERAGQPLSLLVLDEIFGSLDEDRRASVLELLRALSDRFPQVILITHVEGMRDAFDRVIRMTYDVEKGVTTARDDMPEAADVAA